MEGRAMEINLLDENLQGIYADSKVVDFLVVAEVCRG
jgi:hypothetical protein